MKQERINCEHCVNFIHPVCFDDSLLELKTAECVLGKRVLKRGAKLYYDRELTGGYIRYCNEYKPIND